MSPFASRTTNPEGAVSQEIESPREIVAKMGLDPESTSRRVGLTGGPQIARFCREYIERGFSVVHWPVSPLDMVQGLGKGPKDRGWQENIYGIPPATSGHLQIGLKTGAELRTIESPSTVNVPAARLSVMNDPQVPRPLYLAVVDIDDPGLQTLAEKLLPLTGMIGGREGAPRSHFFYLTTGKCNSFSWAGVRQDGMRGATVELFGVVKSGAVGHQVVVAPSVHFKTGTRYTWDRFEEPGITQPAALFQACRRIAEAAAGCEQTKGKNLAPNYGGTPEGAAVPLEETESEREARELKEEEQALAEVAGPMTEASWKQIVLDAGNQAELVEVGSRQAVLNRISFTAASVLAGGEAPEIAYEELREILVSAAEKLPPPAPNMRVWVETIVRAVADGRKNPRKRSRLQKYHRTSQGLADLLCEEFGSSYRYVQEHRKWYRWNGLFWEAVVTENFLRDAVVVLRWAQGEASRCPAKKFAAAAVKWYLKCENGEAVSTAEKLLHADLKGSMGLGINAEDLDRDPWLFCCANGYYDIRTGVLREPVREALITHAAPYKHIPGSRSAMFDAHVDFVFGEEPDKEAAKAYFMSWCGYCLTGSNDQQAILVLHGNGNNGKTACLSAIKEISGDYSAALAKDVLVASMKNGANNDEVAELAGKRWGFYSETSPQEFLNEGRIKALTGGGSCRGMKKYQDSFEFNFITKIVLDTNYRPRIHGGDLGILRRVKLVPFTRTIPSEKVDRHWREKLVQQEGDGLLSMLLQEAHECYKRGGLCAEPSSVVQAALEFRAANDHVATFLSECCTVVEGSEEVKCGARELYTAYNTWARANGLYPLSAPMIQPKFMEKGLAPVRTEAGVVWKGVSLRDVVTVTLVSPSARKNEVVP